MRCIERWAKTFGRSKKNSRQYTNGSGALAGLASNVTDIISMVSDGVALVDGKGIICLFNPAASTMTGWATTDAINLDLRSVFKFFDVTEHAIPDNQNPIINAMHSGDPAEQHDLFLQTVSKKYIRVAVRVIPLGDPIKLPKASLFSKLSQPIGKGGGNTGSGIPLGSSAVVIFRDITSEKQVGHAQSDFISTASHEMRTPVAIIEGYLGMLLNPATATVDSRGQTYARKAHEAAQHLGRLFRNLLDVTRLEDNRIRMEPILVDAGAAARQAVDQLQLQAKEKGLRLTYESAGEIQPLYIIYVDLDQLQEILDNIIGNAIKYTRQGSITVRVTENQGKARISVTDTGIGIPSEDVPHLFQKFYRVDNSDTREIGGTGLGLYLMKQIAEKLGGQVGVESSYGHGSTFWVEFDILTRDQAIVKAREIKFRQDREAALRAARRTS